MEPYVRVTEGDSDRIELQICARRFIPASGQGRTVWLIGVSHLGEADYFSALQQQLDVQGLVLFEGVGEHPVAAAGSTAKPVPPAGAEPPAGRPKLASLQTTLASSLGLAFQLDAIDYNRPNFRNSDLSLPELRKLMADLGGQRTLEGLLSMMQGGSFFDNLLQLALRLLGSSAKFQSLTHLALIEMIGQIQGDPSDVRGLPEDIKQLMKVLIDRRNEKVISDLTAELKHSSSTGSIAIFFGTGHMRDMERRLRAELRYKPQDEIWYTALAVDLRASGISPVEVSFVRNLIRQELSSLGSTAGH